MPRDMFGDVTDPTIKVGGQKWYTVPLSIVVHTAVIAAIALGVAAGGSLQDSARLENRAAGLAVARFGPVAITAAELGAALALPTPPPIDEADRDIPATD